MVSVVGLGWELVEALEGCEKLCVKVGAERVPFLC